MGTRKHPPVSFQNSQVSIVSTIRPKGAPNLPDSVAPSPVCSGSFSPLTPFSSASRPTSSYRPRRGSARSLFRSRSSSSLLDEFFRHPERSAVWQGNTTQAPGTADSTRKHDADADTVTDGDSVMDHQAVSDLVDFLRNHAPPPDNFMSIPDDTRGAPDRGRWLGIRPLSRRSKSTPKRPTPMQLPDSAVAGTTIGGHRHIAISIPIEYSPFGPHPRSQYPVYDKDSGRPPFGEDGSVVRYTDSRGVVTVLRTVSEARESMVADDSIASPRNKFHAPVSVTTAEFPRPPLSRTQSLNEPGNLPPTPRDYHTASLPPTPLSFTRSPNPSPREAKRPSMRDSSYDDSPVIPNFKPEDTRVVIPKAKPEDTKAWPLQAQQQANSPPPTPRRPMPRRWSVFPTGPGATTSIDSVIYGQRRPKGAHTSEGPQPLGRAATYSGRERAHSHRSHKSHKSTASDVSAADFIVAQAMPMVKVCSARNSIVDLKGLVSRSPVTERPAESTTADNPPVSPAPSATSFAESRKSRREKVREKRKRDIEASRASRDRRKLEPDGESLCRRSSLAPSELSTPADTESEQLASQAPRSTPSITPVIVVAEVKPSTPPQSPEIPTFPSSPQSTRTLSLSSSTTPPHTPRGRSSTRTPRLAGPSLSPHHNHHHHHPRQRNSSAASTTSSSTRRRDPPPPAMTTRNFSRRTLVSSPTRIQAARSLDTLYEERMLEMERRMKRLESSGDTWLTAIVPVLDSLNRTLVMMQDDRRLAASSPTSPIISAVGEGMPVSSPAKSESGVLSGGAPAKIARRSTLNEMDLLGMKSSTACGDAQAKGDGKTGASGLDSLEPIMRELQEMSRICAKHQPVQSIGVVESNAAR